MDVETINESQRRAFRLTQNFGYNAGSRNQTPYKFGGINKGTKLQPHMNLAQFATRTGMGFKKSAYSRHENRSVEPRPDFNEKFTL